jgi:hypothetical protein
MRRAFSTPIDAAKVMAILRSEGSAFGAYSQGAIAKDFGGLAAGELARRVSLWGR